MNPWQPPAALHDADIEAADRLLDQADALLRRHRSGSDAPVQPVDADDLPILTDVVDEGEIDLAALTPLSPAAPSPPAAETPPAPVATPPAPPPPAATTVAPVPSFHDLLTEHLIELDTELTREIETWLDRELPQMVARELDAFGERLHRQALEHLRTTLLPRLSDRIAAHLDGQRQDD